MKEQLEAIKSTMIEKVYLSDIPDLKNSNVGDKKEINLSVKVVGIRQKDNNKMEYECEILKSKGNKKGENKDMENDEM